MKNAKKQTIKIIRLLDGWEKIAPEATIGGKTLAQFKADMKPVLDAYNDVTTMTAEIVGRRNVWSIKADGCFKLASLLVNCLKGDPNYGDDCALYAAMGFVRKSQRKSGLTRKEKEAQAAALAAASSDKKA